MTDQRNTPQLLADALDHQASLTAELRKRSPSPGVVTSLIRGFWGAVAALETDASPDHAPGDEAARDAAARWMVTASEVPDPDAGRRMLDAVLGDGRSGSIELEALRAHADLCDRVARLLRADHAAAAPAWSRALRWLPAALTCVAVTLATYEMFREHIPGTGPWRGAYHSQPQFKGAPDIIRDQDIDFNWGRKSPAPEIPNDKISIRWDSCLTLEEDQTTAFQLVANDGARLYVDDKLVVDIWKEKPRKKADRKKKTRKLDRLSGGSEVRLEAGRHRLRVEYRENVGPARVQLLASFGLTDPPSPISADLLTYPGDHPDWKTYCRD